MCIILFLVLAVTCGFTASEPLGRAGRIVGGSLTTIDQYPSGCSVLDSQNLVTFIQSCGGSILNTRSVLSAAHCFHLGTAAQTRIRVGSTFANSGGVVHALSQIINHPNYNSFNYDNDIAILHSATTIVYSNVVQPASIAGTNYNVPDNTPVWAIGWGAIQSGGPVSEQLRYVQVWTVNQEICRNRYSPWLITDNMLCSGWLDVGGRDQCSQDSGGPLYHNNVVIGVCSFGAGCGDPFFPGVNARVSRYTTWIQANA